MPEGIGYASLAGVSPMLGIYAGMVPVAVAAATTGSVLMMSTLTSAIALTMAGVLGETRYTGDQAAQAVVTMTLVAGALMAVLGVLNLGRVVQYVSNAVMTGFVIGVAVLIMVGKFGEIFGFDPVGTSNKVVKAVDIVIQPSAWDLPTVAVGLGTVALALGLKAVRRLRRFALVISVLMGTAIVWLLSIDTLLIEDTATIPTGLAAFPIPTSLAMLPDPRMIPELFVGSCSIALVALAQGAGIRPAFPNPDGSRSSVSRDFLGQGIGNLVGAFFQAAPSGGSLSRTAVSADGGATGRAAAYVAAVTVLVLVAVFGPLVGRIPEAVIGGLLFVIGVELVMGRLPDARLIIRTSPRAAVLFVITLLLTLSVPLQWAILTGAFLSLAAFVVASGGRGDLRRLVKDEQGWTRSADIPAILPADEPLLVRYVGPDFFADVPTTVERLPSATPGSPGVLVLDIGVDAFSSTMLKALDGYQATLAASGSGLVLTGISPIARESLARTGLLATIGPENVLAADDHFVRAIDDAERRGRELLADLRGRRTAARNDGLELEVPDA